MFNETVHWKRWTSLLPTLLSFYFALEFSSMVHTSEPGQSEINVRCGSLFTLSYVRTSCLTDHRSAPMRRRRDAPRALQRGLVEGWALKEETQVAIQSRTRVDLITSRNLQSRRELLPGHLISRGAGVTFWRPRLWAGGNRQLDVCLLRKSSLHAVDGLPTAG